MSNELSILEGKKLPAHLQGGDADFDDWASGTGMSFPVISTKSKIWRVKRGDESEIITRDIDGEAEPVSKLVLVVLKANKGVARTYYEDGYTEGSEDKPTCYSNDGVAPAADAENKQCKTCAACPHSQWGSVITENGKQGKACSEVKRLAVARGDMLNDPMLMRVPPTSLRNWDNYVSKLIKRGLTPNKVITQVSFDPEVSHQLLVFKAVDFVSDEQFAEIMAVSQEAIVDQIIGAGPVPVVADDGDAAEEKPAAKAKAKPKAKPKAKAKAKPKPAEPEEPELDLDGDEGEDEELAAGQPEDSDDLDDDLDLDDLDDIDFGD